MKASFAGLLLLVSLGLLVASSGIVEMGGGGQSGGIVEMGGGGGGGGRTLLSER